MTLIQQWFQRSLTHKLMAMFFAVFFSAVSGLTYFAYTSSRNAMYQEFKIRGRTLAKAIASQSRTDYKEQDVEGLTSLLQSLGEGEDVVAILAYRSSKVLWIEFSGIQLTPEDLTFPELGDVWERDLVLTKGYRVSAFGSVVIDSSTPARKDSSVAAQALGWVRIFLDRSALEKRLGTLILETFATSILTLLLGGGLFIILLRRSLLVIAPLTDATKKVAEGDLHTTVPVSSNDELGELAKCFNSMTEQLLQTTVSKNYVDNVIRSMTDILIVFNPDCTIRSANRAALNLLGYEEKDLLGREATILFPPNDNPLSGTTYHEILAQGSIDQIATTCLAKNGREISVLLSAAVMRYDDRSVQGIACVAKDITELKRAEEQLRLHETALRSAAHAVVITDQSGCITWANPSFTVLTGYSLEEAIGQNMRILKSGHHDQRFYQNLWNTILSGHVWQGEITDRKKDGTLFMEEQTITPVRDSRGAITHFISIKQDVTERKHAENALIESKEYNRTLFELSPIGLALFKMDGTVIDCNEAYAGIVGRSRNDVLGMTYWELTPKEYDEQARKVMDSLTKTGYFKHYEKHYIHRDGRLVPVRLFGNLIKRDNDLYIFCSVEDITKSRQAEEALKVAHQKLTELNESRSLFFADISHELRTPLTVIRGEAEVTLRGREKPISEYRITLERIVQLSNQMNKLVGDLLFLARSESGILQIDLKPTSLPAILSEVCQEANILAQSRSITVTLEEPSHHYTIQGDPERLKQLFLILTDNAIKYGRRGGTIVIRLETRDAETQVTVTDDGLGIPVEDLPHVFERAYRVWRGRPSAVSGAGLGLPIARWIAEAHHGAITITSLLNRGTTVTVRLPLPQSSGSQPGDEAGDPSHSSQRN